MPCASRTFRFIELANIASTMGNVETSVSSLHPCDSVSSTLNGCPVSVGEVSPTVTLSQWLRAQPGLTGTKKMCGEGGCEVCVVTAAVPLSGSGGNAVIAVNSVSLKFLILILMAGCKRLEIEKCWQMAALKIVLLTVF